MSELTGERVHAPTPQRREKARAEGQLAVSRDLVTAASLLAALAGFLLVGSSLANFFLDLMSRQFQVDVAMSPITVWQSQWRENILQLLRIAAPVGVVLFALPLLVHLLQTRFHVRIANLAPNLNRVSPRLVRNDTSPERWSQAGFAAAKVIVVGGVVGALLYSRREVLLSLMHAEIHDLGPTLFRQLFHVGAAVVMVLGGMAVVDYIVQRAKFERGLMMTTQELREELREQNGDPQIAARRRAVQRQLAAQRGGQPGGQRDSPTESTDASS
ncbi:MAG TPA: EscU/YscU/HrcU family type III secretion system export apparatus switch protein [Pirellulales bacterium]|nr:EscU/YscU/HrcU family type III secretion system export apparatus switch protein [Pirellulales bacterium]